MGFIFEENEMDGKQVRGQRLKTKKQSGPKPLSLVLPLCGLEHFVLSVVECPVCG